MGLLPDKEKGILRKEFEALKDETTLVAFSQTSLITVPSGAACDYCKETRQLYEEVAELSDKIKVEVHDFVLDKEQVEKYKVTRIPAMVLLDKDRRDLGVRFYGIPAGYEFASLVEGIRAAAGAPSPLKPATVAALRALPKPVHIQVFVTPSCPWCPAAVHMAHLFAIASDGKVTADMVEASEFPLMSARYNVSSVPKIVINETIELVGAQPEEEYLKKVVEAAGTA